METTNALSIAKGWLLGIGAVLGSGVVATAVGYGVEFLSLWVGFAG